MEKPREILKLESEWGIQIDYDYCLTDLNGSIVEFHIQGGLKYQIQNLKYISHLKNLKSLKLFDLGISDITYLSGLADLHGLDLSFNNIADISPISNLTNLRVLYLTSNEITDISPLKKLKKLRYLSLNFNKINDIEQFADFENMLHIDLSDNKIERIPKKFLNNHLFGTFKTNRIDLFDKFVGPRVFDKIHSGTDSTIKTFDFYNNPLKSPPIHIVEQGREAMLQWWERKEKEGLKPLNEVRVLFLGWGNAGKTSVMRRLIGQEPTQGDEDSTHGINLVPWEIKTSEEQKIKVNLWDFGGQEIQHHTHQFFLAEDCIYVVVVNNRENDEPRYWLEYIRTMANAAPTILLFNKADQARNTQHNVAELMRDYPFIKHSFEIVAARPKSDLRAEQQVYYQENVAAFCTALRTQIETHPFVATEKYPITTFTVKEWVEAETQLGKNHISKKAFRMACESRGVNEIEQNSWLDIFKKIGVITYVEQNLHLDKLLILNPEWMTFAVYRILLHPKTKALQGIISKNDLRELLYQDDTDREAFRKKYRYEDEDFGSIIEIMKEYKLCYTHDNRTLMIPSAFPNNYNSPLEDRVGGLNLKISFKKFLPPSIVNTLIVELMSQQKIRKSWASGMEVVDKELQTEALIKFSNFEREIIIKVFGEHPRELLTLVRHEIKNIKRTFSDTLEMDELVPIPSKKAQWASYKTLLNLESRGKQYFQDQDGDDHSVKLLLENIETPQQTQATLRQGFIHRHEFNFSFRFMQAQPHIETLLAGLEEIQQQTKADHQWRTELLEAIQELNELRHSTTPSPNGSWSLKKIFDGVKDGKDLAEILVLAPDFAEKWVKLQLAYETLKQTYGW
jgi:internalin A